MRNLLIFLAAATVFSIGVVIYRHYIAPGDPVIVEQTDEDESEPSQEELEDEGEIVLALRETKSINGVSITPLEVVEDSRCPIDVTCIQAGTVRLQAEIKSGLGTSVMTLTLNEPITTEAEQVTLIDVVPATRSTEAIKPSQYQFVFEVKKRVF